MKLAPPAVPASAKSSAKTVVAGRYELGEEIGRGGCALIHEVRDLRLGRTLALKVARPDASDRAAHARLSREARASAAVHHPNVVTVSDAGKLEDGRPYLVMERLHGETLTTSLHRDGALPVDVAVDVALQLLSALDGCHRVGIVHRDVKPDNVFLVPRAGCAPLVKLLDFGMCRRATLLHRDDATLTRTGQVVGTPEYMAPEQISGKRDFDARIDVYAAGVVLYEALSGRRAFYGNDVRQIVLSVLKNPPPSLHAVRPEVPPFLARLVARAMERDPRFRFRNATEFQADLLEARLELTQNAHAARPPSDRGSHVRVTAANDEDDDWERPTTQIASGRR